MPAEGFNEAYELVLGGEKRGTIWQHKPDVDEDGLLLVVRSVGLSSSRSAGGGLVQGVEFRTVTWDENGRSFAASDQRGQVNAFQVFKNGFLSIKGPGMRVTCLHYLLHTRGRELVVGFDNGTVLVVDTLTRDVRATLRGSHENAIGSLSSNPQQTTLLTASSDRIILWSTDDSDPQDSCWSQLRSLNSATGVVSASYACGGERIVALLRDGSIMVWDAETLTVASRLHVPTRGEATTFVVTYDGLALVAGDTEGALYLFDITTEELVRIAQLPPSSKGVKKLQVDNAGLYVVALGEDGKLFFLRFTPIQCVIVFDMFSPLQRIENFEMDPCGGCYLVTCVSDATLRLYDLKPRKQAAETQGRYRLLPSRSPSEHHQPPTTTTTKTTTTTTMDTLPSPATGLLRPMPPTHDIIDTIFGDHQHAAPLFTRGTKTSSRGAAEVGVDEEADGVDEEADGGVDGRGRRRGRNKAGSQAPSSSRTKWQIGSLYHLIAHGSSSSSRLSKFLQPPKLQALLTGCGSFPDKHRLLIWKLLLRIPENAEAFRSLTAKGIHPAYANLRDRYPLRSESLLKRLKLVCSALAHWSDIIAELEYAPVIAFPFIILFKGDDLAAFEATLSILLHWQHGFLATFPSPPIIVLSTLEQLLKVHDAPLRRHFVKIGVDAQSYGWVLLRSIFTEVLTRKEWLQLWDHLLASAERPQLLLHAVVAYLIHQRRILLSVQTKQEVESILRKQNAINVSKLLTTMFRLEDSTPPSLLHLLRRRTSISFTTTKDTTTTGDDDNDVAARQAILEGLVPSADPWPLPAGFYPAFEGYPKYVVDYQMQERARIAMEEEEIRRKREYMDVLGRKTEEVARAEQVWLSEKQILIEAEEKRRQDAEDLHLQRLAESKRLDEMMRGRRLQAMEEMERGAERSLQVAKRLKQVEAIRMKEEVERMRQRQDYELRAREEEEKLLLLERKVNERIAGSMLSRFEEDRVREMRAELERKREILELEDRRIRQKWSVEDAEREAAAKAEQDKREHIIRMDTVLAAQAEVDEAFVAAKIERDIKLTNLEKARRLRHLQEEQAKVSQEAALARVREAEAQRKQDLAHVEEALRATRAAQLDRRAEREMEIEREQKAAHAEAEKRARKAEEMERRARRKALEEKILSERQKEVEKAIEEERDMQHMLLTIEKERMQERSHRLRSVLQEEEKKAMEEFQSAIQEAEAKLIEAERRKFDAMREELRQQGAQAEEDLVSRHARKVAEIEAQRRARVKDLEAEGIIRAARAPGGKKPPSSHLLSPSTGTTTTTTSNNNNNQQAGGGKGGPSSISAASSSSVLSPPPRPSPYTAAAGGSLAVSPPSSSSGVEGSRSGVTETPSLEKALNLDVDGDGGDDTSLGGDSDDDESVVRDAHKTLERHRKLKAEAALRRRQLLQQPPPPRPSLGGGGEGGGDGV